MEKMEFKSRDELEDYVQKHKIKYCGSGEDGKSILLDNVRFIKVLHNSYDASYALPFKDIKNSSFIFEDEAVTIDGRVHAVLMDEGKGVRVSDNKPVDQDFLTLGNQLRVLTSDICKLSEQGVLIRDFHTGNLLYDGEKFTVIDTFRYVLVPQANYKEDNLREVMSFRNGIYPFLLSEITKYRVVWDDHSYYGRMECLEYPNHYFEELKTHIENVCDEEFKTLGEAEMVLKRRNK